MTAATRPAPSPPLPPPAPAPAHLPALDVVRVLATGWVIAIHVLAWAGRDTPESALWYRTLDLLVRLSVPWFVMLTGVVLGYGAQDRRPAPGAFLARRLERVALPWLFWALVWIAAWLLIRPLWTGEPMETPAGAALAIAQGPGYLYFLLLILQLSAAFVLFPASRRGRLWAAGAAVALQLALTVGRLAVQDPPAAIAWMLGEGAYEIGAYWIGYFALGVLAGSAVPWWSRPSPARVMGVGAAALAGFGLLLAAPQLGWWDAERLNGANSFLHPLFLPAAGASGLLLYWASDLAMRRLPGLARAAAAGSAASFGVYLVHQYPLDLLGPVFQQPAVSLLSEPLPASLPAVAALFALTLLTTGAIVAVLRRFRWGSVVLGEAPGRRRLPPQR